MMELTFRGGGEVAKLVIDRKNKKLKVATKLTNFKLVDTPWKNLFDKGKETIQEKLTDKLDDHYFKKAITMTMAQQGYELIKDA